MARTAEIDNNRFRMIVDLPYAAIHNEGGEGKAFGKYPFTMPKRTFVGQTNELTTMQRGQIDKTIKKIWNV
jgi:phage gpG-like protein